MLLPVPNRIELFFWSKELKIVLFPLPPKISQSTPVAGMHGYKLCIMFSFTGIILLVWLCFYEVIISYFRYFLFDQSTICYWQTMHPDKVQKGGDTSSINKTSRDIEPKVLAQKGDISKYLLDEYK